MADFNTNDLMTVTYQATGYFGVQIRNVFAFRMLANTAFAGMETSVNLFFGAAYSNLWETLPAELVMDRAAVFNLTTDAPFPTIDLDVPGLADVNEENWLPQGASAVVTGKTSVAGVFARKFLPVIAEGYQGGGILTNIDFLAGLADFAEGWARGLRDGFDDPLGAPVVITRSTGLHHFLTNIAVRTALGYLRSRKTGVGI